MRIKKILFLIASLIFLEAKSQKLNLIDLEKIYYQTGDKMDTYLSSKGFEFESIKDTKDANVISYLYKLSSWEREYLTKYKYNDGFMLITYSLFDSKSYSAIKQSILNSGFVFVNQESNEGKLILTYKKGKLFLKLWSGKVESANHETYNAYEINIKNRDY